MYIMNRAQDSRTMKNYMDPLKPYTRNLPLSPCFSSTFWDLQNLQPSAHPTHNTITIITQAQTHNSYSLKEETTTYVITDSWARIRFILHRHKCLDTRQLLFITLFNQWSSFHCHPTTCHPRTILIRLKWREGEGKGNKMGG